jgi:sigma-E factor negative regulatory protein RseC
MVQNAIVKKVVGEGVAEVSLLRQMECGLHCDGACAGCGQKPTEEILALASNPIGAAPGDIVEVEPASGHNIGTSVVVFLLPCVGLAVGYLLGQSLFHLGDLAALGTAALGLVVGFVPALLINRAISRSQAPEFNILKLLS